MTKDELFDLFKLREKARAYYERMSMSGIKHDASVEEKFEAEFRYAQAKREYETLSRQYQLAQDKYLNGEEMIQPEQRIEICEISEFSMNLISNQKRLDTEFLTVLNQNSWELYEKEESSEKEKFEAGCGLR